ncbi:MAG: lysophospholipid acyltransferase family protein [Pseudomonadota bacterium]
MLKVQLLRILLEVLGHLPLGALQRLGSLLGLCLYASGSRMARVSRDNVNHAFRELSPTERERLVRTSMKETGKVILETAFAWTAPVERCNAAIVTVEGKAWVDRQAEAGKGLIFVMPHLGNWEMINHFLGREYGLTHMYQPNRSTQINALVQQYRGRTGTNFVEATPGGLRAQMQRLAAGGSVGMMPDQEPEVHTGEFANFFGELCLTSSLLPRIVDRTGATCVMAYCERLADGAGFRVVLTPFQPMSTPLTPTTLNQEIERVVRRVPEQYLWSYKRFRTRPPGEPERYTSRDPAVIVFCVTLVLWLGLAAAALLPLSMAQALGSLAGRLAVLVPNRYARQTRTNLKLCGYTPATRLIRRSLVESGRTLLETGFVWLAGDASFNDECVSVEGLEHLPQEIPLPLIVLTPPLGNREVVMRFLGSRFRVTEFYHPASSTAVDDLIRHMRTAMGIALVPHTRAGIDHLATCLARAEVITLCPDQQPRLRSGLFVPFFGQPALTATAISELASSHGVRTVFAAAIREGDGFRIHFSPCDLPDCSTADRVLAAINKQLEEIIRTHPAQYRWSDKRFNIRPRGMTRPYRR